MILDDIVEKRKLQLEREIARISPHEMKRKAESMTAPCRDFRAALSKDGLSVIAEVKKASPSKGLIQPDFDPEKISAAYEAAGADAISCLTEEYYFQGSSDYLQTVRRTVNLPILRKDFIFDEYQIYEARVIGADAILLIAAILDEDTIRRFRSLAGDLGLYVLAESHNEEEFEKLLSAGCDIIGINNRDLKTFEVSLETTDRLAHMRKNDTILVSESGIRDNGDMKRVRSYGADGVLIGETLVKNSISGIADCMNALRKDIS
ncbi:MAG: indole-3-glycerol phosphate synthase TrpC [Huintestinicola sp.]